MAVRGEGGRWAVVRPGAERCNRSPHPSPPAAAPHNSRRTRSATPRAIHSSDLMGRRRDRLRVAPRPRDYPMPALSASRLWPAALCARPSSPPRPGRPARGRRGTRRPPPPTAPACSPGSGVDRWHAAGHRGRGVKVAVIDSGFRGYRSYLGTALPRPRADPVVPRRRRPRGPRQPARHPVRRGDPRPGPGGRAALRQLGAGPARHVRRRPSRGRKQQGGAGAVVLGHHAVLERRRGRRPGPRGLAAASWAPATGRRRARLRLRRQHRPAALERRRSARRRRLHEWRPGQTDNGIMPWGDDERVSVEVCWPAGAGYTLQVARRAIDRERRSAGGRREPQAAGTVRWCGSTPTAGGQYTVRVPADGAVDGRGRSTWRCWAAGWSSPRSGAASRSRRTGRSSSAVGAVDEDWPAGGVQLVRAELGVAEAGLRGPGAVPERLADEAVRGHVGGGPAGGRAGGAGAEPTPGLDAGAGAGGAAAGGRGPGPAGARLRDGLRVAAAADGGGGRAAVTQLGPFVPGGTVGPIGPTSTIWTGRDGQLHPGRVRRPADGGPVMGWVIAFESGVHGRPMRCIGAIPSLIAPTLCRQKA